MNLQQLIAAVYTETNRPDYAAETLQAILASTLKLHLTEFFFKDVTVSQLQFTAQSYQQSVDTSLVPLYRSFSFLKKNDQQILGATVDYNNLLPPLSWDIGSDWGRENKFITMQSPTDILDEYNDNQTDICYQIGTTISINSSTATQYCLFGYYIFPQLDIANGGAAYSSWIANEHPYAIVFDACYSIFSMKGDLDQAARYVSQNGSNSGKADIALALLKMSNIVPQGY